MVMFREGDHPQSRKIAADTYAWTFGYDLANGEATPCTEQGQKAEYVFNDTVKFVKNGLGVGVHSLQHSGGTGVPVLAGGPILAGHEIVVGIASFTCNDGVVRNLPVAIDIDNASVGDYVVGKATMGTSATAKDTDVNRPSIAIQMYNDPYRLAAADDIS